MRAILIYGCKYKYLCSTNNKNPKTEIGVYNKNQKTKADKPLEKSYFYHTGWYQSKQSKPLFIPSNVGIKGLEQYHLDLFLHWSCEAQGDLELRKILLILSLKS